MSRSAPSTFDGEAPSGSGEFDEHDQLGLPDAVAFGETVTQADGGEGRFERIRGSYVLPVFGGEVVEGQPRRQRTLCPSANASTTRRFSPARRTSIA